MEPLKPEEKERILENSMAAPEELEEYERLLAERYMADPDLPLAPPEDDSPGLAPLAAAESAVGAAVHGVRVRRALEQSQREQRLALLHQRLFPARPAGGARARAKAAKKTAKGSAKKMAARAGAKKR